MRTIIYIDGFNLYYGCLKGTPYKWLDLLALFQNILDKSNDIVEIRYFTAKVSNRSKEDTTQQRQMVYLRALGEYVKCINIQYGFFSRHSVQMAAVTPPPKFVDVWKTEEKGSDVNLAVNLLNDAWLDKYDCAVVVSNDSDMAESMRLVKLHHPKKVLGLITPNINNRTSQQLRRHSDFVKSIRQTDLAKSQLPSPIPNTNIFKPDNW